MQQGIQRNEPKKDGPEIVNLNYLIKMVAKQYQKMLENELNPAT